MLMAAVLLNRGHAVSKHRRLIPLTSLLCLLIAFSACDDCYSSGVRVEQTCQVSGTFTLSVAPLFNVACPPALDWDGNHGSSFVSIYNGCTTDDGFWVLVSFPRGVTEISYPLPSSEVGVSASFEPAIPPARDDPNPRPTFSTDRGSLALVGGAALIHSSTNYGAASGQENYGIDAELDLRFWTSTGAELSVSGRVVADQCVLQSTRYCVGD
jgi:hypothetical protein